MSPQGPEIASVEEMSRWRYSLPVGFRFDTAVFLLLVFSYLWLIVDPRLVHHGLGILSYYYPFSFHTGYVFFQEHLARPGGLAEYALRFLTQGYALGWPGALIITAIAWHLTWSTDALGRWAGRPRGRLLRLVPGVLLVVMHGSYSHPLGALLPLQAGLVALALYVRWAPHGVWKRAASLLVLGAILYHVAGSGSVIFPALVATYELLVARRPTLAAAAIGFGLAVPWASAALFAVDLRNAYGGFLVSDPGILPGEWPLMLALYLFFPAVLAATSLGVVRGAGNASHKSYRSHASHASHKTTPPAPTSPQYERRLAAVSVVLVLLGGGWAAWFSLDTLARTVLEMDHHSQNERWDRTLAAADRLPTGFYDVRCHRNVMLALYHTQRLGDEMFRYPQRPGVDLFSTPAEASDLGSLFQESRLFLELGHVNQAEKGACETLETSGELPAVLEQLAIINVVKGRPETARIFYHALALQPLQRRTAGEQLERLAADPQLAADPRVAKLRGNMVAKDYVALDTSVEQFLQLLLERNPRNRMAFELLMAHYLAIGRPDGVVAGLSRLQDLSYARIPRLYQEAAVIHARTGGKRPRVPGYELDAAVLARGDQFAQLTAAARNRETAVQAALAAGFGDSYFFYWAFGFSGQ